MSLQVGFAEVDYTPEGVPMLGNFRDDYMPRGVHDPLYGHAIIARIRQLRPREPVSG